MGFRITEVFPTWILDYESRLFPVYGNRESEVFPVSGNRITGVGWMSEMTRGRVDNENNNQSRYSNILNIVQGGGLYIYESESIAIRNRNILEYGSEHRKAVCTGREIQECYVRARDRNRNKNKNRNWNWG